MAEIDEMNDTVRQRVQLQEHPTGLSVARLWYRDATAITADRSYEVAMRERWGGLFDHHGVVRLGIRRLPPEASAWVRVDQRVYDITPLRPDGTIYPVPHAVRLRVLALQQAEVPFACWVLAKERPVVRVRPVPLGEYDPILIGVLPVGRGRGLWCAVGLWFE